MSLLADNVSYSYPADAGMVGRALSAASVCIEPGSVTLIVGPTGSGKSTLLRLLAGLLVPSEGSVLLDGASPMPGDVGLVFQQPEQQLFAETVLNDVMFGPINLGVQAEHARSAAIRALEAVGLDAEAFADRSPFSLSGGEARRAAIAGVLAMGRKFVLFDEPTAGLDASGRAFVCKMLADLAAESTGVVVVSHAIEELLPISDRVVMVYGGEIRFDVDVRYAVARPELFERSGLRPPPLLDLQSQARSRGFELSAYSLDPELVGTELFAARERRD